MSSLSNENDLDFAALVATLWAVRKWIVSSAAVFGAAFALVAFLMDPVYRATVVVVPVSSEQSGIGALSSVFGQLGGLASLAGINLGPASSRAEESLAVLRARTFTQKFIDDQGLMLEFAPPRPSIFARLFGDSKEPTLAKAYRYFDRRVRTIFQDRTTGLISISIDWTDPALAASWANALVAQLNEEIRRRAFASAAASVDYLQKALAETTVIETRQAINQLMEMQINQEMFASVTEEYAFRVIDPAMAPDPEDPIKPKKALLILLGIALGGFIASLAAVVARLCRPQKVKAKASDVVTGA